MDTLDKKSLLEKQIEDEFIVPALQKSGWHERQIVRQESYTAGRIIAQIEKDLEALVGRMKAL